MEEADSSDNLNTVEEMILDEQKLVTYANLSKELCIHVNVSKSLLASVVENIRKKQPEIQLNVNYVISGLCEGNTARTTVCSEKESQSIKGSFKVVFFEHVYSVSKGFPKVDNVALMGVNKFEDFPLCVGLIKSSSCTKRSFDEIRSLKTNIQEVAVTVTPQRTSSAPVVPLKKIKVENKLTKSENVTIANVSNKADKVKTEANIKTEVTSPKKDSNNKQKLDTRGKPPKGIAGFFNKQNGTAAKKILENPKDTKELTVKNAVNVIDKQTNKLKEEQMEIDEVEPTKETAIKNKKNTKKEISTKKSETNLVDLKKNGQENGTDSKTKKNQAKNKSLTQIKKTAKVDKKRKRVLKVSDSDSDDEKDPFEDADETPVDNHESDDEIPPTPTVNTVKITSGIVNPRKRRKIVDKTYTDEEGYILTKKVEVYESCSDNEEKADIKENVQATNQVKKEVMVSPQKVPPKEKKEAKNSKKKISPPQKGKQATMMNFFKKV